MTERQMLHDALPSIVDNVTNSQRISKLPEVAKWIKKVLEHNVNGGKLSRALMTMFVYKTFEKPENITEEKIKLARVLGWCGEMAQGLFIIVDDIIDVSETRRGFPCWYLMPEVGTSAVNDAVFMSSCLLETLEIYFLNTPHYIDLVRIFHETILYTSMGQRIDYTTANLNKNDYSLFTIEHYNTILLYKTTYYTFKLPLLLGLTLVKDVDKRIYAEIDDICFKLGELYQLQNDYLDCFGDVAMSGKIGTDIQEGKCTWFAIIALQLSNKDEKELFAKHYGSKDPEDVAVIKNLYHKLGIPELYKQKEAEILDEIVSRFSALPLETAPDLFLKIKEVFRL